MSEKLAINTNASAMEMADSMFGNGIKIVSASYTGAQSASGIYSGGDTTASEITPSDSGVILSTGRASDVTSGGKDVNVSSGTTTQHHLAGDKELSEVSGQQTYDASVLEAEFVPEGSTLTMQVVFSSEEYLEYVDSGFNDAVGIWVNGQPAKMTIGSGDLTINNINDVDNANLYVDNSHNDDTYNTQMDGFTVTLTLKAPVIPGEVNTIKIGIADGGDGAYDSNLLIAGDSVQTALVAEDDEINVTSNGETSYDLLANDSSTGGGTLTLTHINGQPVAVGDTVTLASGEVIELTPTGLTLTGSQTDTGANIFSYTVADDDGNTDVGFVTVNTTPGVVCFATGTMILTPSGEVPVERLRPGDLVVTADNGPQPLIWSGMRRLGAPELAHMPHVKPIEIRSGAFGNHSTLVVSPQHGLLLSYDGEEVMVRAKHLAEMRGGVVRVKKGCRSVTYCHLLFEQHQVIFSNGIRSESFFPGPQALKALDQEAHKELIDIFPFLNGDVEKKTVLQSYGHTARQFLPRSSLPLEVNHLLR
ncbi:choice-of-anchor L domain-containing protein [Phaeobacter sp. A47a-4a]|uniref:choice-of-anchor L domain-containing protein n=2 Tax=Phaeobacter TaxID=302485 RepID=UPI003A87DC72